MQLSNHQLHYSHITARYFDKLLIFERNISCHMMDDKVIAEHFAVRIHQHLSQERHQKVLLAFPELIFHHKMPHVDFN